jgi:hypothetical protein
MKRAISFFAVALGTAAVAFPLVSKCISASPTPSSPAANGLECHRDTYTSGWSSVSSDVQHIEFLPNNKYRGVQENAKTDAMADDYIGEMITTDTTYTFGNPKDWGSIPGGMGGFTVNRLTTRLEGYWEGSSLVITQTGWCIPDYIPPRPIPKKL